MPLVDVDLLDETAASYPASSTASGTASIPTTIVRGL
jgi:hypothetical protein